MKIRISILIAMAVLIAGANLCFAADPVESIDTQIKALNDSILSLSMYSKTDEEALTTAYIFVYKDGSGKIRSIQYTESGEEFRDTIRAYYDVSGNLIFFLASSANNGGTDAHLRLYIDQGKVVKKDVVQYTYIDDYLNYITVAKATATHSDFMSQLEGAGLVTYKTPGVDSRSTILAMGVNVRDSASTKGKVVGQLNSMDQVTILSIGKKKKSILTARTTGTKSNAGSIRLEIRSRDGFTADLFQWKQYTISIIQIQKQTLHL